MVWLKVLRLVDVMHSDVEAPMASINYFIFIYIY